MNDYTIAVLDKTGRAFHVIADNGNTAVERFKREHPEIDDFVVTKETPIRETPEDREYTIKYQPRARCESFNIMAISPEDALEKFNRSHSESCVVVALYQTVQIPMP